MRMSELSRRSGVAVATIKYYLREGLLPPGRAIAATQAEYDEDHLRRLRLVRALISVRGLSVQTTAAILRSLPADGTDIHLTLGLVLGALDVSGRKDAPPAPPANLHEVDALVEALGWRIHPASSSPDTLARTLESLQQLGLDISARTLLPYGRLAEQTADIDLDQMDVADHPLELAERAILLTVLLEPALMALRRMAQEHRSALRNGAPDDHPHDHDHDHHHDGHDHHHGHQEADRR